MATITIQWLLLQYQPLAGTSPIPLGIVAFVPDISSLVFRFREDLDFVRTEDHEFVAESQATFAKLAVERGAEETFQWMADTLSNTVRADGPFEIATADVNTTIAELYRDRCRS